MSEFTYLFRGRKTSGSPEEMQKHFEKWVAAEGTPHALIIVPVSAGANHKDH